MKTKNEIIGRLIDDLSEQRKDLNIELSKLNHNECNYIERRQTLQDAIFQIDSHIQGHINMLELTVN